MILAQLTSATSFIAMAVSLWLGCYLVTRSPRRNALHAVATALYEMELPASISPFIAFTQDLIARGE